MKTIIAGSRTFNKIEYLVETLSDFKEWTITEVVSGCAKGVDTFGEIWAEGNNLPVKKFPANWNEYGKRAGPIRNEEMAKYANACIIFWDGNSKGTKNMIENAKKYGLKVMVYKYEIQN